MPRRRRTPHHWGRPRDAGTGGHRPGDAHRGDRRGLRQPVPPGVPGLLDRRTHLPRPGRAVSGNPRRRADRPAGRAWRHIGSLDTRRSACGSSGIGEALPRLLRAIPGFSGAATAPGSRRHHAQPANTRTGRALRRRHSGHQRTMVSPPGPSSFARRPHRRSPQRFPVRSAGTPQG